MKILLGISGSIAAYKTIDLARELTKKGHQVKIILTKGAEKFLAKEVFGYLGVEYYSSEEDFRHTNVLHVDLAKWCDVFAIVPMSANTLSRLVKGEASDLLTSVFLAYSPLKPLLVFPAMNTNMLNHPFTQENLKELTKIGTLKNIFISGTKSGLLVCGDEGEGKLPDISEIIELIETVNPTKFKNDKILISTGASIVPIDPVRFLTNSSSGITGFLLAKSFLQLGFKVQVAAGINSTPKLDLLLKHPQFELVRLKRVHEFDEYLKKEFSEAKAFIASAALSDFEIEPQLSKIKKDQGLNALNLKPAPDVLKNILELKQQIKGSQKIIGFAAETNLTKEMLQTKQHKKPVDLLIGTLVSNGFIDNKIEGFNEENAHYRILKDDQIIFDDRMSKADLGNKIQEWLKI